MKPEETEALRGRIEAHLRAASGEAVSVAKVSPLAGGAVQELLRVEGDLPGGARVLVLRADAPRSLPGSLDRRAELAVIEAAVAAGVRTPRARWLADGLVRPASWAYFLEWADGVGLGRKVVADPSLEAARARLPEQLTAELAKIHSVRPEPHDGILAPLAVAGDPVASALAAARDMLARLPEPRPALELALAWLEENPARDRTVSLVHGDFRTGNFLVGPEGLVAVLDWEFAHWGSPLEDLAWLCLRDWRFGRLDRGAGGLFSRETLRALYSTAVGREISADDLRFWEVFGNVRWGAGAAYQGERARVGAEDELELLAVARRASEMELEALRLIGGLARSAGATEKGASPVAGVAPRGAGSAVLEALARFLEERVKPGLGDPALGYRALVGASLARSLAAEARGGAEREARESARLTELVGGGRLAEQRRELVVRIQGRKLSGETLERARGILVESLRESLAVTSPKFDPDATVE